MKRAVLAVTMVLAAAAGAQEPPKPPSACGPW